MHTNLAPHLHTEECNKIIAALQKCHAETPTWKQWMGFCNDFDFAMRKCCKQERLDRTAKHYKASQEKREAIKSKSNTDWRSEFKEKIQKEQQN